MDHRASKASMLALAVVFAAASCASRNSDQTSDQKNDQTTDQKNVQTTDTVQSAGAVVLRGKVIQKPWSKSVESWNAGGSEYYVLDVGDAEIAHRSAAEGVTLKPTEAVSEDALASMVGKQVEVSGTYVEARPYQPSQPTEQYPMDMDGKPLPRGAGFAVESIKAM